MESEYFITSSVYVFGNRRVPGTMPSPDGDAGQELNAYALFGEAYYQVTDDLRLTLGGRWTQEEKDFLIFQRVSGDATGRLPPAWGCGIDGALRAYSDQVAATHIVQVPALSAVRAAAATCNSDGNQSWTEFTPRLSLDYAISDDVMTYASWSRGFRSGGFNGRATTSTTIGPYDPEKVLREKVARGSTVPKTSILVFSQIGTWVRPCQCCSHCQTDGVISPETYSIRGLARP